jgi:hypothetical protein
MERGRHEKEATMCTQTTLISVLISGLIAFAAESVAIADVAMIPNTRASGPFGLDRDAPLRERLACTQPIPHQVRENPATNTQDNRAYLYSVRPDPGWNSPSEELKMPNIFVLMRIPLDRTVTHPFTPNLDSPVQNDEVSQAVDLAGDPLHLRLTHPLPHGLC